MKFHKKINALNSITLSGIILKVFVVLCFSIICTSKAIAQKIEIKANNTPLSQVLVELRKNHNVQLSYNHHLLSKINVTVNNSYSNINDAVASLLEGSELKFENHNGVIVIFEPVEKKKDSLINLKDYFYAGQLVDAYNTEPLPFSSIQINHHALIADANGKFAFKTSQSTEGLRISHLGYFMLDTIIYPGTNQKIELTPSVVGLKEVIVGTESKIFTAHIGEQPGLVKLNHKVATFLPGNNNNTIFNMLRLQPGILASAEQSGDYVIWGSFKGQNLMLFDGITIFNASSLNNEIGVVNPLLVKDVEVLKGGYNVDKSGRVGAVVDITGKTGNTNEFEASVNVNSQTVSGLINVPIKKQYAFQASFRQSYYSVFDWDKILNREETREDHYSPIYDYQDINLKFSGKTNMGDNFYLSLLGNNDKSSFDVYQGDAIRGRAWENESERKQIGGAAFYNKSWNNFGYTNTTISYSRLQSNSFDRINYENNNPRRPNSQTYFRENGIDEFSLKTEHIFPKTGIHNIKIGFGVINNTTFFIDDTVAVTYTAKGENLLHYNGFIMNTITLGKYIELSPGLNIDFLPDENEYFLQPRVNGVIKPHSNWKINFACGIYNQFISEMQLVDELENRFYYWGLNNNIDLPVNEAIHSVFGISYNNNRLKFGSEGFYKTTEGLSKFNFIRNPKDLRLEEGRSRNYGIDFYLKKEIADHSFWVSYTISRAEEDFSPRQDYYRRSLHDQTHEFKAASIINLKPWYISANYVYGSGLYNMPADSNNNIKPYNRVDLALLYKFKTNKFNLEAGASVINLLNNENIAFGSLSNLPGGKMVYSKGSPFTPSVFVNISF